MTLIVKDNLVPQGYADDIEADVLHTSFKYGYIRDVTNSKYGNNSGFAHVAYDHPGISSDWFQYIKPLTYSIEEVMNKRISTLYRIRVGLLIPTRDISYKYNSPHVDFIWPHYTACYYVNDCDGDTVIFNETLSNIKEDISEDTLNDFVVNSEFTVKESVSPQKNRIVIFDGYNFHASTKPVNSERRAVITINFI